MADKSFGVKELNLLNASGTPTVTSPNNLNLNANTVAISTSATVGNNLTVTSTTNSANLNVTGIGTLTRGFATDLSVSGISTISQPSNANPHSLWDVVNNGSSAYRFTGPGQDGAEDNPDIYLVRGQRYVFKMNASGHPFQIRVSNGGSAYSDGVTNNGAQTGNVVFNVQHDAPAHLFYQCTSHGSMVGNIYIVGQHLANGANNRVLTATSAYGINAESDLTFDGTTFKILNTIPKIELNDSSGRILQVRGGSTSHNPSIITQYASPVYIGANNVESVGIGSEHLTITNGNLVIGTAGHGIDFSATGGGSNTSNESELFDDYEEGSCAVLIHDAVGSNISVTNNTFKYTKIGNRVFISGSFVFAETGSKNGGLMVLYQLPFVPAQSLQATGTYWYDGTSDGADVTGVIYVSTNSSGLGYLKQSTTIGQPSNNKYLTFNEIQKNSSRPLHASFSYNVS